MATEEPIKTAASTLPTPTTPTSIDVETSRASEPPREPSAWSRLPSGGAANGDGGGGSIAAKRATVKQTAAKMWGSTAGVRAAIRGGAEKVTSEVGERLQKATDALDGPDGADIDHLYTSANLPELEREDPIASLALRLDRESDLWRNLALRALTRAGWADRIAQGAGILTGLGAAALAVIAGLGALFGAEGSLSRVILIAASVGVLSFGPLVVTWISGSIRKAQRDIAREALQRADLAELRLHRIGVVTALLQMDEAAGR